MSGNEVRDTAFHSRAESGEYLGVGGAAVEGRLSARRALEVALALAEVPRPELVVVAVEGHLSHYCPM